jgi:hypothetical protein
MIEEMSSPETRSVRKNQRMLRFGKSIVSTALAVSVSFTLIAAMPSMAASKACKVPAGAIAYGRWRVMIKSFTRDGSALIKPPSGRVTMAMEVVVSTTKAGDSPGRLLDINLQPTGARRYRGTIIKGEDQANKDVKANEKVTYTLVYPVETKDKDRKLSVELNDFSGAISEEKLVAIC